MYFNGPSPSSEWLLFVMLVLATWRLTSLFVYENGPLDVFLKLRTWDRSLFLMGLLNCSWCTSVWTAAIMTTIITLVTGWWALWLPLVLAASAGGIIIEEMMSWRDR